MAISERVLKILKDAGLSPETEIWEIKGKNGASTGNWAIKHRACEVLAQKHGITFDQPIWLASNPNCCAVQVCASMMPSSQSGDPCGAVRIWEVGEASADNTTSVSRKYPFAMADKRAKDRAILKLLGIHGWIYAESEAEDFAQEAQDPQVPVSLLRKLYSFVRDTQDHAAILNAIKEVASGRVPNAGGQDRPRVPEDQQLP